jgi:hypothetical protein
VCGKSNYTLHEPSKYDRWGLYSVDGKLFSIDGTAKATVVRLVRESEDGRTHSELQELLRIRVQSFLREALRKKSIDREMFGRLYIYLHTDPQVRVEQLRRRQQRISETASSLAIDDEVIIRVLLVLIRYPGSGPGDVVRHLRGYSPPIERPQVDVVFAQFGLGEKGGPRIY